MANIDVEEIKLIIKSILISHQDPPAIAVLNRDYRESEGREIPFTKLGYSNILDFLHSLRDTVVVLPNNTVKVLASADQKHLLDLVSKQRRPKRSRNRPNRSNHASRSHYTQTQFNRQRSTRQRNQTGALSRPIYLGSNTNNRCGGQRQSSYRYSNMNTTPERPRYQPDSYAINSSSSSSGDSFEVVTCHVADEEDSQLAVALPEPEILLTKVDFSSSLSPQLKNNILEIIKNHGEGVRCSELSQLVREKYGISLNYRRYGFTSMLQLVDSIKDIVKVVDKESSDWILFHEIPNVCLPIEKEAVLSKVCSKVCDRIYEVAKTLTSPMPTWQFNKRYENMFRMSLTEEVPSYKTIDFILASVDQKFVRMEKVDSEFYVVPFSKSRPDALDADAASDDDIIYPSQMLPLGGEVPPLEAFSDITPVMKVYAGEIYNPHKFFMISANLKDSHSMLDKNIQLFYAKSERLALTNLPVKTGLYCVAPYLDKWHRAVILHVRSPSEVVVYLIDFGTYLKVLKQELRFLHESFSSIPRLALRAILHDIAPLGNGDKFSAEANRLFLKLTADKELIAHVKKMDMAQQKYLVQLAERVGDSEVLINEKLVTAGVAEYGHNVCKDDESINSSVEVTSNVPSPAATTRRLMEALKVQSTPKREETSANSRQQPKKSPGALLMSLLNKS